MSRKHFRAIAQAIREAKDRAELECKDLFTLSAAQASLRRATWELADQLRLFNPRFDRRKFYCACGF